MIRALLAEISQNESHLKPDPEMWSILEVIYHLHDEEREDFRKYLDFILHRQGEKWHQNNPQAWVADRKYNEQNFRKMSEKFFAERKIHWNGCRVYQVRTGTKPTRQNLA